MVFGVNRSALRSIGTGRRPAATDSPSGDTGRRYSIQALDCISCQPRFRGTEVLPQWAHRRSAADEQQVGRHARNHARARCIGALLNWAANSDKASDWSGTIPLVKKNETVAMPSRADRQGPCRRAAASGCTSSAVMRADTRAGGAGTTVSFTAANPGLRASLMGRVLTASLGLAATGLARVADVRAVEWHWP